MEKDLKLLKKDTKKSNNNFKKLKAIKIKKQKDYLEQFDRDEQEQLMEELMNNPNSANMQEKMKQLIALKKR